MYAQKLIDIDRPKFRNSTCAQSHSHSVGPACCLSVLRCCLALLDPLNPRRATCSEPHHPKNTAARILGIHSTWRGSRRIDGSRSGRPSHLIENEFEPVLVSALSHGHSDLPADRPPLAGPHDKPRPHRLPRADDALEDGGGAPGLVLVDLRVGNVRRVGGAAVLSVLPRGPLRCDAADGEE